MLGKGSLTCLGKLKQRLQSVWQLLPAPVHAIYYVSFQYSRVCRGSIVQGTCYYK